MFYIISSLIIAFLNFYAYKRFLRKISFLGRFMLFIRAILILLCFVEILFAFSLRFGFLPPIFDILFGYALGLSFILFTFAVIYDILLIGSKPITKVVFDKTRRKFIRFFFDITLLIGALGYFFKGAYNAFGVPKIKMQDISIKRLENPLKIAVLTDIHLGVFLGVEFAKSLVEEVNKQDVDMVFIVGDIADLPPSKLAKFVEPFANFHSKFGTFYVPGNHEYYSGIEETLEIINRLKVRILGNDSVEIGGVNVAGVYDLAGIKFKKFKPDLELALSKTNPQKPTILLAHQPKFVKSIQKDVDLVVCGHTHGGQIFPFSFLVMIDQKFLAGLYKVNDKMQVYVSRGAGFWGPPLRVLAPSEISILNLRGDDEK